MPDKDKLKQAQEQLAKMSPDQRKEALALLRRSRQIKDRAKELAKA